MSISYRITKYDPRHRDVRGRYLKDEWTSISDINMIFEGVPLTPSEYLRVETLYVQAVNSFLVELEIPYLEIHTLTKWREKLEVTNHRDLYNDSMVDLFLGITEGDLLEWSDIIELIRLVLRDELGCKLKYQQKLEVHFGYDYYMYVILEKECTQALDKIKKSGLHVELYESPYREE